MRAGETTMASAIAKRGSAPSCNGFAKCRRADNMIFWRRVFCAGVRAIRSATVLVAQAFRPEGVPGGGRMAASGKLVAGVRIAGAREGLAPEGVSYRASSSCKSFAKCRRADIFQKWKMRFGVAA
jgi:hypothetical protein